jgi:putative transposase
VAQSLVKNLVHLVFSTLNREPSLAEMIRAPLCAYAAAVLRDLGSPVLASDAWRDHVHVLFSLSKNHPLVEVVIK